MKRKKVGFVDVFDKYIYDDNYGISYVQLQDINFVFKDGQNSYRPENVYFDEHTSLADKLKLNRSNPNYNWFSEFLKTDLFNNKLYRKNRINPYGYNDNSLIENKLDKIRIIVNYRYLTFNGSANNTVVFDFDNMDSLRKQEFILIENHTQSDLSKVKISDVKVGEKFYDLHVHKTVEVIKVNYPAELDPRGDIVFATLQQNDGTKYNIGYSNNLYYLPFEKGYEFESILDENKNELDLQPFIVIADKAINVFWKSIPDASNYIVSLYKIITYYSVSELYHLKDYDVDRNDNFLQIDNLLGDGYVLKVSAENRSGDKIAISRGLYKTFPKFYKYRDK